MGSEIYGAKIATGFGRRDRDFEWKGNCDFFRLEIFYRDGIKFNVH